MPAMCAKELHICRRKKTANKAVISAEEEDSMKRVYVTPKAKLIDFTYDEQVTASSSGDVALFGDPQQIGRCQQSSATSCKYFWNSDIYCQAAPMSLHPIV